MAESAPNPLLGGWRLRAWVQMLPDGSERQPFGPAPDGLLIYDAHGLVAVQFYGTARDPLPAAALDPAQITPDAAHAAFLSMNAYWGRYTLRAAEQIVVHHVLGASLPNRVGTDLARRYELLPGEDGGISTALLRLEPLPGTTLAGGAHVLTWARLT